MAKFKSLSDIAARFKPRVNDVVGIDLSTTGTKLVRLRKGGDGHPVLVGAEILEPTLLADDQHPDLPTHALHLPTKLRGRHAALTLTSRGARVKLLHIAATAMNHLTDHVVEGLGLSDAPSFRIAYTVLTPPKGKQDAKVMAVAVPESEASAAIQLFPSGVPAPHSLEVSGLSTMSAFLNCRRALGDSETAGVLDLGARIASFGIIHDGVLNIFRRIPSGLDEIFEAMAKHLAVERDLVVTMLSDESLDVSDLLRQQMAPLLRDIALSKDFVERRENCRVAHIYIGGAPGTAPSFRAALEQTLDTEIAAWDPFASLNLDVSALPDSLRGQEHRFAAAVGAALEALENG